MAGIAAGVAVAILVIGLGYTVFHTVSYESRATVALVPTAGDPADRPTVLDSLRNSGAVGTYVELLSSADTLARTGFPNIDVSVRAIPDTRVIEVKASGSDKQAVRPTLASLLSAAERRQSELRDVWELKEIEGPSRPQRTGPTTALLLIATMLLSLFGAVAVLALTRRVGGEAANARPGESVAPIQDGEDAEP